MKIQNLVAVAAFGLAASTAWAQSHPSAPGIASSTVGGIFVPRSSGSVTTRGVGSTFTAPAATPVSVQTSATVAAVVSGTPSAVATFTQSMSVAGVPAAAAQGIATALQQLSANPTVGTIATALASWNATIASLSPTQVSALMSTSAGRAAARSMLRAYRGARAAR